MCPALTDKDLAQWYVGKLPDKLKLLVQTRGLKERLQDTHEIARVFFEDDDALRRHAAESQALQRAPESRAVDVAKPGDKTSKPSNPVQGEKDALPPNLPRPSKPFRVGPCRYCKGRGHYHKNCPNVKGSKAPADTICFRCNGTGHYITECTTPDYKKQDSQPAETGAAKAPAVSPKSKPAQGNGKA